MRLAKRAAEHKVCKAINQRNNSDQTPLILACAGGHLEAIHVLLANGADPWLGDAGVRRTCMHYAAGTGKVEVVRAVIEALRSNPRQDQYQIPDDHPPNM